MLRTLGDLTIYAQQVRLLKRLESEEVIVEIARKIKLSIDALIVVLHDLVDIIR